MTDTLIQKIITHIQSLTNNKPYEYLRRNSDWFSDSFVFEGRKDSYPYIDERYRKYFSNRSLTKFEKDILLKFLINEDFNNNSYDKEIISMWLIKVWGGIKGIKKDSVIELLGNLKNQYSLSSHPIS
jgi:hypothetical protein